VTFTKLGVGRVKSVHADDFHEYNIDEVLNELRQADGVFFVGGQPYRITEAIKDTPIDKLLHERYEDGLILAGTSAGALMMPEVVIMDGQSRAHPTTDTITTGAGMGFLHGMLLDVHFAERGRAGRMLAALSQFPDSLGIGIDEDAA
jgi:cyanophycinase